MPFYIQRPHARETVKMILGASTVSTGIGSSDIGRLMVTDSTVGTHVMFCEAPVPTTFAASYTVQGILAVVPTATTQGSTIPVYIEKIKPGDKIEADYSTDVETSTGIGDSLLVTSNIGYYFGIGAPGGNNTTTIVRGLYIDPSIATTAAGTTANCFFKMESYSTVARKMVGTINSTNIAP
jgi:hypothetical protein